MDVLAILGPGGPVAAKLPRYEERPQQRELAAAVDSVMRDGGRLLAEAGTGVGKSFAYLVPAVAAAAERGERVVVATHTIALQEQLLGKDVPFLTGLLPAEFSVVLAKGRGNYLCLRRMHLAARSGRELFDAESEERDLARIMEWAETTDDGTRQTLEIPPTAQVWSRVNAEAGNCMGRSCEFYDRCHYQAGRRRLQNANLIVANHHFLFADLALRKAGAQLLPDYDHLVLDEAHAVEDVAGEYLGMHVTRAAVHHLLRQLATPQGKGLLHAALAPRDAIDLVGTCRAHADEFFAHVDRWMAKGQPANHRITEPNLFPLDLADALDALGRRVLDLGLAETQRDKATELQARASRCHGLAQELHALVGMARDGHVYWAEREGGEGRNLALASAPIDVGPELAAHLWARLKSATLTSATLSTGGERGFAPLAARLGLDLGGARESRDDAASDEGIDAPGPATGPPASRTRALIVGSPFRYGEQARLIVDARLPDPRTGDAYEDALPDAVVEHVARTNGHAFVLFTSFQSLDRCHAACAAALRGTGCTVLKQGEGMQRTRMIEEFRKAPSPVLFGTDSFWEGVDVPDNVLRNVIIARLPFAVPTHPLQEARTQAIKDRGGDAFGEYSLPHAILKLKQGFGRLIRSTRDTGIVVVLDRRMATMSYGRRFVAALPKLPIEILQPPRRESARDAEPPGSAW
jgi:ATP-dependent DNA helicase DinG